MAGQNRDERIAISNPRARLASGGIFGYILSVLLVALSMGLTALLRDYTFRTPLFLLAILISTWFGGTGPGLLAVLLSTLSINFFILDPRFAFSFSFRDAVHLAVFLFTALLISSWSAGRRRVEHALKRASADLEDKVADHPEQRAITAAHRGARTVCECVAREGKSTQSNARYSFRPRHERRNHLLESRRSGTIRLVERRSRRSCFARANPDMLSQTTPRDKCRTTRDRTRGRRSGPHPQRLHTDRGREPMGAATG